MSDFRVGRLSPEEIVERKEFTPDTSGQDWLLDRGFEQAALEERARRDRERALAQRLRSVDSNIRALDQEISREQGRASRAQLRVDADLVKQWNKASNQAARDQVIQEFKARLSNRSAQDRRELAQMTNDRIIKLFELSEAGKTHRAGIRASAIRASSGLTPVDKIPPDSPAGRAISTGSREAARLKHPIAGLDAMYHELDQDPDARASGPRQEQAGVELLERLALQHSRAANITIDEAMANIRAVVAKDPRYAHLVDDQATAAPGSEPGPVAPGTSLPRGADIDPGTTQTRDGPVTFRGWAPDPTQDPGDDDLGIDTEYVTKDLTDRRKELGDLREELAEELASLGQPVDMVGRSQEIARVAMGGRPRIGIQGMREAKEAQATQVSMYWLKQLENIAIDPGAPGSRAAKRELGRATSSHMFKTIEHLVKMGNIRTDWNLVRRQITNMWPQGKNHVDALSYYKLLRYAKDNNINIHQLMNTTASDAEGWEPSDEDIEDLPEEPTTDTGEESTKEPSTVE